MHWPVAVVASALRSGSHDDEVVGCLVYAGVGFLVSLVAFVVVPAFFLASVLSGPKR